MLALLVNYQSDENQRQRHKRERKKIREQRLEETERHMGRHRKEIIQTEKETRERKRYNRKGY